MNFWTGIVFGAAASIGYLAGERESKRSSPIAAASDLAEQFLIKLTGVEPWKPYDAA